MSKAKPEKENLLNLELYAKLKRLGKEIFSESSIVKSGIISPTDVGLAREFMTRGAKETNPQVRASYWEHITIAPELGKRIAEETNGKLDINPAEVEMLLWLHDIGRLVTPSAYFRNDLIGDRLLLETGFPKKIVDEFPPLARISVLADEMELTEGQLNFTEPSTDGQEKTLQAYFDSLTPTQRIINLADNLGKRDKNGIFSSDTFLKYLETQEERYSTDSFWSSVHWATERRRGAALLEYHLVEKRLPGLVIWA
jgi:hypothetical protein